MRLLASLTNACTHWHHFQETRLWTGKVEGSRFSPSQHINLHPWMKRFPNCRQFSQVQVGNSQLLPKPSHHYNLCADFGNHVKCDANDLFPPIPLASFAEDVLCNRWFCTADSADYVGWEDDVVKNSIDFSYCIYTTTLYSMHNRHIEADWIT